MLPQTAFPGPIGVLLSVFFICIFLFAYLNDRDVSDPSGDWTQCWLTRYLCNRLWKGKQLIVSSFCSREGRVLFHRQDGTVHKHFPQGQKCHCNSVLDERESTRIFINVEHL